MSSPEEFYWETITNKIKSIKEGWGNLLFEDPQVEMIAEYRTVKCAKCTSNIANMCSGCGCFIPAKVRSLKAVCPMGKWLTPELFGFINTGNGFFQNEKALILMKDNSKVDIKKFVGDGYASEYVFRGIIRNDEQLMTILELTEVR